MILGELLKQSCTKILEMSWRHLLNYAVGDVILGELLGMLL